LATDAKAAIDRLIDWTSRQLPSEEVVKAREEYFWKTGKVFIDDPFYEERISYFLDGFVLDRPVSADATIPYHFRMKAPVVAASEIAAENSDVNLAALPFPSLLRAVHTIFEVRRADRTRILGIDMLNAKKLTVAAGPHESFEGIVPKQIVQTHLVEVGDVMQMSRGIIFHPREVVASIRKFVKVSLKADPANANRILSELGKTHLRHLRHRNVAAQKIYLADLLGKQRFF
jgi:hypothetical protein